MLDIKSKTASFDVDAQYTFTPVCPDELPVPGGELIGAELNAQACFASVRVGSKDAHSPSALWISTDSAPPFSPIAGANLDIRWPAHAQIGSRGFALLDALPNPCDYDYFVWKGIEPDMHPYGACFHDLHNRLSTGVIEYLRARGISTVIVGGLALDYCVLTTVMQLRGAGFAVVLNRAACRGIAADTCASAEATMCASGVHFIDCAAELATTLGNVTLDNLTPEAQGIKESTC
jgi:nicotinamidase/pyrazinamidase